MAITLDGTTGITTPGLTNTGTETIVNLTTTGNTTLGDATTDTLTVGVTGIVKDASGNVGIGTASPSYKTEISAASATNGIGLRITNSGSTGAGVDFLQSGVDNFSLTMPAGSGGLRFIASGSNERMRIDSSGNLLVGCTAVPNGTSVYGSAFDDNGASTKRLRLASSVTSTIQLVSFYNPNGNVGNITTNASATAYATSSDYRLKDTIAPMTGALNKISALKPVTYKWKADGSDGEGFIAHELSEIVPQCVIGEKDAVDADGNPVYQGIDTSFLVATLTAAIQEQQALITALTARIIALETP